MRVRANSRPMRLFPTPMKPVRLTKVAGRGTSRRAMDLSYAPLVAEGPFPVAVHPLLDLLQGVSAKLLQIGLGQDDGGKGT
ncbi:hypothetical protein TJA_09960 [Thermus sp. LT1-2-5]